MKEHKHCKVCKAVIEPPDIFTVYCYDKTRLYNLLGVCKRCAIKAGIKSLQKKYKNKPDDMEFGKND